MSKFVRIFSQIQIETSDIVLTNFKMLKNKFLKKKLKLNGLNSWFR